MKYDFDEIIDRSGTDSMKWENITTMFPDASDDVLSMWVADMDFACAPAIINAIKERADKQIFGYSHASNDSYLDSVTGWFARRFDWKINRNNIVYAPGIVPALGFLANLLTEEGDGIVIQRPIYYPFTRMIEKNDRVLVNSPLRYEDNKYTMDFEDLEEKFKAKRTKAIFFCSPHNPSGRVWTIEELTTFVALCKKYDIWIVSDEIHCDLINKGVIHTPLEKIDPSYKHKIITCTAPSKTFNIAGIQMSNIIINDEKIRNDWHAFMHGKFGLGDPNGFALVACQAAYDKSEEWVNQVNEYIDGNFQYIENFIREKMPKTKLINHEGTYLAWLDMNEYGLTDEELRVRVLVKANVALDDGYIFGPEGSGFQRINVACPRSRVEQCMLSLEKALKDIE